MIRWFVQNSVAANLLMLSILGLGLFSAFNLVKLEVFPSYAVHFVSVSVDLPGATPSDAEEGIAIRVEEAIQDLDGIQEITSIAVEGNASTSIKVQQGYDERILLADVKGRIDGIRSFPTDSERPVVSLEDRQRDVISVTLASPYGERETYDYAKQLRDELLRDPEINQVVMLGTRNREISLNVSRQTLLEYDLSMEDIAAAIRENSLDVPAGSLKTVGGDILLRSVGQSRNVRDFANIPVRQREGGATLLLGSLATIEDGFEESPVRSRFNGQNAVILEMYRTGDQTAIEITDAVKSFVEEKQAFLPAGYVLQYWDDESELVRGRLSTLGKSAIQGGILVLIILSLFLRPTIAFWVFAGIPVAFMGAFLVLPFAGVSLNIFSLFAFVMVLGIVVDDAIVTGENIYTRLKTADSSEEAVVQGTKEVARPVTFGVLTTMASFLPLAFIQGDKSPLFTQIPWVVVPILLFSLIESKFILPSHLRHLKMRKKDEQVGRIDALQSRFADGFERMVFTVYQPVLRLVIRNKLMTAGVFLSVFAIVAALLMSGWMRFTFFPDIPAETVEISLEMPAGTPFEVTNRHVIFIADKTAELQQKYVNGPNGESVIKHVLATTGESGGAGHVGEVEFEILPPEARNIDISAGQLADELRDLVGEIPGAEVLNFSADLGGDDDPVEIRLSGASLDELATVTALVRAHLASYPGLHAIKDNLSDGKEQLRIDITKEGRALGLTRADIAFQVRQAFFGLEVQTLQQGRDDIKVMLRLPADERDSVAGIEQLMIRTSANVAVPLKNVARLVPSRGPASIIRIDRYRAINVTADADEANVNMLALEADMATFMQDVLRQYPGVAYSMEGDAREQKESFSSLLWGLLFVFFLIYALLAIPFKSYSQPLIVMSIIPFGLIGAVIGHWITGMNLTLFSLLGMLALVGIVVNDSLVLVDYINKMRRQGMALNEAVVKAGTARFRPVILTSLTTFIGLVPLLFEQSTQAQMLIPMAISLAFGILFATVITLILIPINYLALEKLRQGWRRLFSTGTKEEENFLLSSSR